MKQQWNKTMIIYQLFYNTESIFYQSLSLTNYMSEFLKKIFYMNFK